jgi:hypothetical protein
VAAARSTAVSTHDAYYSLPRDEQWLSPGNPEQIGGRTTDSEQIGLSIMWAVRERWPINGVPADIAEAVEALLVDLRAADAHIARVIDLVSRRVQAELDAKAAAVR